MSAKPNGGPAFPVDTSVNDQSGEYGHQTGPSTWQCAGMTLRDYFAAHAPVPQTAMSIDEHCGYRYHYADAMLKARAQ